MDKPITSIEQFAAYIREYDSDTFNGPASDMTPFESLTVAGNLLAMFIDNYLDGDLIREELLSVLSEGRKEWLKSYGRLETDVMYDDDNQDRAVEIIYADQNKKIELPKKYQLL